MRDCRRRELGMRARLVAAVAATSLGVAAAQDTASHATLGHDLRKRPLASRSAGPRVAFAPEGNRVLGGCIDGCLKLWDAATGDEVRTVGWNKDGKAIEAVAFSPSGRRAVAGGKDSWLAVFESREVREVGRPAGPHDAGDGGRLHPRRQAGRVGELGTTRSACGSSRPASSCARWAASPRCRRRIPGSAGRSQRRRARSGCLARRHPAAERRRGKNRAPASRRPRSSGTCAPAESCATSSTSRTPRSGRRVSPDGKRALTAAGMGVQLWDVANEKEKLLDTFRSTKHVNSVGFSRRARASSRRAGTPFAIWEVGGREVASVPVGARARGSSPDEKRVAVAAGRVRVWDLDRGQEVQQPEGHDGGVRSVGLSADGHAARLLR